MKNWLIRKDPDAWKDWRQEEKGMTEDEIVGWHHRLNGHEFEQSLGVGDGQEAWRAAVHGVAKYWMWLSHWTELEMGQKLESHGNDLILICVKYAVSLYKQYVIQQTKYKWTKQFLLWMKWFAMVFPLNYLSCARIILI